MTICTFHEEKTATIVAGTLADRARWIQKDHWVNTPASRAIIQWSEYMVRSGRVSRPICMQIAGGPGTGKTELLKVIEALHPIEKYTNPLRWVRPVLRIGPSLGDEGIYGLYKTILASAWPEARALDGRCSRIRCDDTLRSQHVRVLLIDEAIDLLACGPSNQKKLLAEFKRFGTDLSLNIVCASVEGLEHAIELDRQLKSRFVCTFRLSPWKETQEFRNFLHGFEMYLPFSRPSELDSQAMVKWLLSHSNGSMGEVTLLIKLAALFALDRRGDYVSIDDFETAHNSELPPRCALALPIWDED